MSLGNDDYNIVIKILRIKLNDISSQDGNRLDYSVSLESDKTLNDYLGNLDESEIDLGSSNTIIGYSDVILNVDSGDNLDDCDAICRIYAKYHNMEEDGVREARPRIGEILMYFQYYNLKVHLLDIDI